jgi:hypothetical protein
LLAAVSSLNPKFTGRIMRMCEVDWLFVFIVHVS